MAKLRIGLLNDDTSFGPDVAELVRWARGRADLEVSHLVLHPRPTSAGGRVDQVRDVVAKHGVLGTASRVSFRILTRLESAVLQAQGVDDTNVDLAQEVPEHLIITPQVSASGYVYRFSDADVAAISEAGIDVLIRCGTGILKGGILNAAPFGILSFHHGDNRVNRGGPPGFWEVQKRWPSTGFVLQQLTEELDGGRVLVRGSYPTELFYAANRRSIVHRSAHHLRDTLVRLAADRDLPAPLPSMPYSGPLLRTPNLRHQALYGLRQAGLLLARGSNRIAGRKADWGVAYTRTNWRRAVLRRGKELPAPSRTFLADPFVVEHEGEHYCFVEEFDYATSRGRISVFRLGPKHAERVGTALDEPFHLSFPYLFRYEGELFMCPECNEAGDVRIYRCTDFPLGWQLATTPLKDIRALDTLIFPFGDKWWLLTTADSSGDAEPASELMAYSADSPLTEHWEPHPRNPLRNDTETGRNGGLVQDETGTYRVTQRQGFATYGAGAAVRRIVRLDADGLVEEEVADLSPDFLPDIQGVHHLHSDGACTVFDYVRRRRPR